jgi:hypothetical protein
MTNQSVLILPESYEDVVEELGDELAKMMQFVVPVEDAEKELAIIAQSIRHSGKIVFLLGISGVGKSTFIQSLTWRKFLPIPEIHEINASNLGPSNVRLENLFIELSDLASNRRMHRPGLFTVVVNYLEDFSGHSEDSIRAFFRDVNGLLRRNPMLIIWPVTQQNEVKEMLRLAHAVSGTVFADKPVLTFQGPPMDLFPQIAKNTITTLNRGLKFDDFQLTEDDFDVLLRQLQQEPVTDRTIRVYLRMVKQEWAQRSDQIGEILDAIPKFTEVWFVVCYPESEGIVGQFARKSPEPDLAWNSDLRKFSEYITESSQKAAEWDQQRLVQAMQGYFKVKVMYMPTHSLVSCVATFGDHVETDKDGKQKQVLAQGLLDEVIESLPNHRWRQPSTTLRFLNSSPMVYQLKGQGAKFGQRRGRSTSVEAARDSFLIINKHLSSGGEGSDQPINKCLALGLQRALEMDETQIIVETAHPWLDGIRPDIMVFPDPDKIICIEMHYTADPKPYVLANYVLNKMNTYMKQLKAYLKSPRLFLHPQ